MTISSKTALLDFQFVRAGSVFANVTARTDIVTSDISTFVQAGNTYFGVSDEVAITYTILPRPVRLGNIFNNVAANSNINASEFDFVSQGRTYWTNFTGTPTFVSTKMPIRMGNIYKEITANGNIDASEFDYVNRGAPFYVYFSGTPPPITFDATQFFLIF